jgi:tetratricopeptide (TPR) repeat protein
MTDARESSPARVAMEVVESRVHERLFGEPIRTVTIGRFRVLSPAGAGGMGVVFAAHDPELDRRVAIKLVGPRSTSSSQARLKAEARTMARLSHPNIVAVHDVGAFSGGIYVAMEYIDGDTLDRWLAQARAWPEIVDVFVQAGRGLAAAHGVGVVHGDFKPSNAMIDRSGVVRVVDFGLATEPQESDDARSSASSGGGTFLYMAPEQRAGERASMRSDQYAFCLSLSQALREVRAPRWLRRVLQRGLAAEPLRRWPTMDAVIDALVHGRDRARRRWVVAGAIALIGVAVIVAWPGSVDAPSDDCHGFALAGARAWDVGARRSVEASVEGPLAVQLIRELDDHAEELREARASACAVADRGRLQCLDRAERELASTIVRVGRARPDNVAAISMAVAALDVPASCDAFEHDEDPEVAQLLADANVSLHAGLAADALEISTLACARLSGHEQTVQWAQCQVQIGDALVFLGRYAEALPALEQAHLGATRHDRASIEVRAAELAARSAVLLDDRETAERWLGSLRVAAGRVQDPSDAVRVAVVEAELLADEHDYAQAITRLDALVGDGSLARASRSRQISTRLRLARYRGRIGDSAGAERDLDVAAALAGDLPESHALVAATHAVRGQHLQLLGRHEEAIAAYRIAHDLASRYRSPDDPMAADASGAITECLTALGRLDEALVLADENVRRAKAANPGTRLLIHELLARGQIHAEAGNLEAAERDDVAALTLGQERRNSGDVVASAHLQLANVTRRLERYESARSHAEQAIAGFSAILGPDHAETQSARLELAAIESASGSHERAIELSIAVRESVEKTLGPDHPELAIAAYEVGVMLERAGRLEAALSEFERSMAIWREAYGEGHPDTLDAETAIERVREAIAATSTAKSATPTR